MNQRLRKSLCVVGRHCAPEMIRCILSILQGVNRSMTRKIAILVIVVAAVALGATAQTPASAPAATGPAPTKIGIINIQAAIVNTNEGQRDFQALEKKMEPKKAELQKASADVEDLKK